MESEVNVVKKKANGRYTKKEPRVIQDLLLKSVSHPDLSLNITPIKVNEKKLVEYPLPETKKLKETLFKAGIDCVGHALNHSETFNKKTKLNSWFSNKLPKIFKDENSKRTEWKFSCLSPPEKIQGITKIKLYPTSRQKKILALTLKSSRLTYNNCINDIKSDPITFDFGKNLKEGHFNKKYAYNDCGTKEQLKIQGFSNSTTRQIAAQEAIIAYNNETIRSKTRKEKAKKQYKKLFKELGRLEKQGKDLTDIKSKIENYSYKPEFNCRSVRDKHQSFTVSQESLKLVFRKKKLNGIGMFPIANFTLNDDKCTCGKRKKRDKCHCYRLGDIKTKKKVLFDRSFVDSKIIFTCGHWFLHLVSKKKETQDIKSNKICAIDPGLRTFMTTADIDGNVSEFGINTINSMNKLIKRKENSQAELMKRIKWTKEWKLDRKSLRKDPHTCKTYEKIKFQMRMDLLKSKRKLDKTQAKISNRMNDMHHKISKELVEKYDVILYPPLSTTSIVKSNAHEFNKQLYCLSHYKFTTLLEHKALIHGKKLVEVCEAFTSKTCLNCLQSNTIGKARIHRCECGYEADRDINAAFNILLKNISLEGRPQATGDMDSSTPSSSSLQDEVGETSTIDNW